MGLFLGDDSSGYLTSHALRLYSVGTPTHPCFFLPRPDAMTAPFKDFDLADFWEDADEDYGPDEFSDDDVKELEQSLGYKLPASYVALMRTQNGGFPTNTCCRMKERTSWADDHIAITGIFGIGTDGDNSLGGSLGSQFWIEEWNYPAIGVYFADCPSAGHDMICLDYRECGSEGEPRVVHIDQEFDFKITQVASTFEDFIRGLEPEDSFDDEA